MDIFPMVTLSPIGRLLPPSTKRDLALFLQKLEIRAAIPFLDQNHKIFFEKEEMEDKLAIHFQRLATEACIAERNPPTNLLWELVAKRMRNRTAAGFRKNADVRVCFYTQGGIYFVKYLFTFGVRQVKHDNFHIFQTNAVGLFLYVLPNEMVKRFCGDRTFRASEQFSYKKYFLEPHMAYQIPAGTIYTILAYQKTMFSVHVVRSPPPFPCRDYREPTCSFDPTPGLFTLASAAEQISSETSTTEKEANPDTIIICYPVVGQKNILVVEPPRAKWARELMRTEFRDPHMDFRPLPCIGEEQQPMDLSTSSGKELDDILQSPKNSQFNELFIALEADLKA